MALYTLNQNFRPTPKLPILMKKSSPGYKKSQKHSKYNSIDGTKVYTTDVLGSFPLPHKSAPSPPSQPRLLSDPCYSQKFKHHSRPSTTSVTFSPLRMEMDLYRRAYSRGGSKLAPSVTKDRYTAPIFEDNAIDEGSDGLTIIDFKNGRKIEPHMAPISLDSIKDQTHGSTLDGEKEAIEIDVPNKIEKNANKQQVHIHYHYHLHDTPEENDNPDRLKYQSEKVQENPQYDPNPKNEDFQMKPSQNPEAEKLQTYNVPINLNDHQTSLSRSTNEKNFQSSTSDDYHSKANQYTQENHLHSKTVDISTIKHDTQTIKSGKDHIRSKDSNDEIEKRALEALKNMSQDEDDGANRNARKKDKKQGNSKVEIKVNELDIREGEVEFRKKEKNQMRNEKKRRLSLTSLNTDKTRGTSKKQDYEKDAISHLINIYKDAANDSIRKRKLLERELLSQANRESHISSPSHQIEQSSSNVHDASKSGDNTLHILPEESMKQKKGNGSREKFTGSRNTQDHTMSKVLESMKGTHSLHTVNPSKKQEHKSANSLKQINGGKSFKTNETLLNNTRHYNSKISGTENCSLTLRILKLEEYIRKMEKDHQEKEERWNKEKTQLLNAVIQQKTVEDLIRKKSVHADQYKAVFEEREKRYQQQIRELEKKLQKWREMISSSSSSVRKEAQSGPR